MKKFTVLLVAFMIMVLAACGSTSKATYEMDAMGMQMTVDLTAKGDKIEQQKLTMAFPYDLFMVETKEEAESLVKDELEKELEVFSDLKGVEVSLDFKDDHVEQVTEIDFKKANFEELQDVGLDIGADDDYMSFEKITENLEDEGFEKVK